MRRFVLYEDPDEGELTEEDARHEVWVIAVEAKRRGVSESEIEDAKSNALGLLTGGHYQAAIAEMFQLLI
ncbi:MAG: hypothetical protein HYV26_22030 [Candidatus Hydrogenedentes bacterium]|nr:hypothetical protein [Candidatus Hydrogenedentota bacterium]